MSIDNSGIKRKKRFEDLKKSFDIKNQSSSTALAKFFTGEDPSQAIAIPLYGSKISAGFATIIDDHIKQLLDLNKHLIKRLASTFLVRVEGDSMTGVGIFNHDILIFDRAIYNVSKRKFTLYIDLCRNR